MNEGLGFDYAQARMQARLAQLPSEADWERLAAARGLSSFLEEARGGALRIWVKGFSAHGRAADLELGPRVLACEQVEQVATWVPGSWRSAVIWLLWVPWLPLVEHLERGEPPPDWLTDEFGALALPGRHLSAADRRIGAARLADSRFPPSPDPRARFLAAAGGQDAEDGTAVGARWLAAWIDRWPPAGADARAHLQALVDLIGRHLARFRTAAPETAWDLRRELRARLRLDFHRQPLTAVAVFAYLSLVFLDLERLRGELLRRALFGPDPDA